LNPQKTAKPRIVIYGTGQYGGLVTRIALDKGYTVVAAFNRSGPKVGQDLGRLAGLGRDIGVIIQDCDAANYDNLEADIGLVVQTNVLRENLPAYKRLMNAGLNVLCHGCESYYPWGSDPLLAPEIDALAKENGVTFTGTGIWDMSRIWSGILLAGPCTEIKSIFHRSITDNAGQGTPKQIFEFGIGLTVEEYLRKGINKHRLWPTYRTVPEHVLAALGYTVTKTRQTITPVVFDEPYESAFLGCVIPAGNVLGTRVVGEIETKEGVTGRIEMEGRMFRPGEVEHMFWSVEGKPRNRVTTERLDSDYTTAASLFGRIRQVIAAPPGIVLISQMGPLQHTALS
jgi:hypothetical protein